MRIYAANLIENRALQKINREKCMNFAESNVYLHNQSRILQIFGEVNVQLRNQSRKEARVLPIFSDMILKNIKNVHNQ